MDADKKLVTLEEDASKHIVQVLRMEAGDQLQLTDGKGNLFTAEITAAHKKQCTVQIISSTVAAPRTRNISIAISLVKNSSRLEWFLEKATEIGISGIIPLLCNRTEKQHFRFDRMTGILVSAMLQSQQSRLPVLHGPVAFKQYIRAEKTGQRFIAHCIDEANKNELNTYAPFSEAVILVGPEGDFTPEEIALAIAHNYIPVALGATRLRTETAGLVAASLMANL